MKLGGVDLNPYSVRARLRPVLFIVLPVGFGIAAWYPAEIQGLGWLIGAAVACGVTFFSAETAADVGRQKQEALWTEWGGAPTTIHLRHRTSPLNSYTLVRYHEKLRSLRSELEIPTPEEEAADTEAADVVYASCVDFLREATRNKSDFSMVFSDNVNYGYRRNLWALKAWGIATSMIGLAAAGGRIVRQWLASSSVTTTPLVCGGLSVVFLLLFTFVVRKAWVKQAGFSYAVRLLASLERL